MNAKIADAARSMAGTPFLHQGRNPAVGLDCVGLWVASLQRAGFEVRDFKAYRRFPCGRMLLAKLREQFRQVARPEPGDLIVIRHERNAQARHVGVYLGDGQMAHADGSIGRVVVSRVPTDRMEFTFRAEGASWQR